MIRGIIGPATRSGKEGRREFIQVLRLLRSPCPRHGVLARCERFEQSLVEWAMARAVDMGAISFDAVKMIVLAGLEHRPGRLEPQFYPHLPRAQVGRTDPRSYMGLLSPTNATAAGAPA